MCDIKLDLEKFKELAKVIGKGENAKASTNYNKVFKNMSIKTTKGGSLCIASYDNQLVLQSMYLLNQRKGTGTFVLNWLKDYATSYEFNSFVVESVFSEAMGNLCQKLGFEFYPRFYKENCKPKGDYIFTPDKDMHN